VKTVQDWSNTVTARSPGNAVFLRSQSTCILHRNCNYHDVRNWKYAAHNSKLQ